MCVNNSFAFFVNNILQQSFVKIYSNWISDNSFDHFFDVLNYLEALVE